MLGMLFRPMLEGASPYYEENIGLSPIALARPKSHQTSCAPKAKFWEKECSANPYQIACLNYES